MQDVFYRIGKYRLRRGWPLRVFLQCPQDNAGIISDNRIELQMSLLDQDGNVQDEHRKEISPLPNTQTFKSEIETNALKPGVYQIVFHMWDGDSVEAPDVVWILDDADYDRLWEDLAFEKFEEEPKVVGWSTIVAKVDGLVRSELQGEFDKNERWMLGSVSKAQRKPMWVADRGVAVSESRLGWIVRMMIEEFRYLGILGLSGEADWRVSLQDSMFDFSVRARMSERVSKGVARALAEKDRSDLFIMSRSGDIPDYECQVGVNAGSQDVVLRVGFRVQ